MDIIEQVTNKKQIYPGKVIDVQEWTVTLPNGQSALREVVLHKGAAAIVAINDQNQVAMVRQYRVALGRVMLELPAGKLDRADEDPLLCAQRELREETGLTARNWQKLMAMVGTPGYCSELVHIYLATGLDSGQAALDEDEFLNFTWESLPDMLSLCHKGEIQDAKTVIGLLLSQGR